MLFLDAQVVLMENSVRLLPNVALETLACTEESVRTSALALTALVRMIILVLAASTNLMLVKLDYARTAQRALMTVKIIPASVPLASKERTVMKTSLTARRTLAHHQRHV